METPVTITVQDSEREPTAGVVRVSRLSVGARVARSLKVLAILWAVAVGCLPLPGLHFVLVPGFFVAGIVFAVERTRASVVVDDTELPCPKCGKRVPVEPGTTGWPVRVQCNECSARLMLTPREAGASPG
jgi:DNA-directed RNA polymerase subunit RPC12/RpoP